jgi:predicted nucleic acid-binding protein
VKPIWLIDAGPLIALIRQDDRDHRICVRALASLPSPVATTWPVVTEAVHVVETPRGKNAIFEMVERRTLQLLPLDASDIPRIRSLIHKYRSQSMDLADATLVRVAERDGLNRIFTLDTDFRVYRLGRDRPFTIVP